MDRSQIATDLDYIISLGYSPADARKAIQTTNGDLNAALHLLAKGIDNISDASAWRQEMSDDWIDGVNKLTMPRNAESRGLYKTPVYIRISRYREIEAGRFTFQTHVTLKDGRQWSQWRTYTDFSNLKYALPLGTCFNFKNAFPGITFGFRQTQTKEFLEQRMLGLNEWLRELVLTESCMTSEKVLDAVYKFVEIDSHGGPVGIGSALAQQLITGGDQQQNSEIGQPAHPVHPVLPATPTGGIPAALSPLAGHFSTPQYRSDRPLHGTNVKLIGTQHLPLPISHLLGLLPFRVDLKKLPMYQTFLDNKRATQAAKEALAINTNVAEVSSEREVTAQLKRVSSTGEKSGSTEDVLWNDNGGEEGMKGPVDDDKDVSENRYQEDAPEDDQGGKGGDAASHTGSNSHSPVPSAASPMGGSAKAPAKQAQGGAVIDCPIVIDKKQLEKDYGRDRVIIHGRKILGNKVPIETIIQLCCDVMQQMITEAADKQLQPQHTAHFHDFLSTLSQCTLQAISRTESAYFSHACLHDIMDVANSKESPDFVPFLFVPESVLADAVEVRFRLQERQSNIPAAKPYLMPEQNSRTMHPSLSNNFTSKPQEAPPLEVSSALLRTQSQRYHRPGKAGAGAGAAGGTGVVHGTVCAPKGTIAAAPTTAMQRRASANATMSHRREGAGADAGAGCGGRKGPSPLLSDTIQASRYHPNEAAVEGHTATAGPIPQRPTVDHNIDGGRGGVVLHRPNRSPLLSDGDIAVAMGESVGVSKRGPGAGGGGGGGKEQCSPTASTASAHSMGNVVVAKAASAEMADTPREWCICCDGEASSVYRVLDIMDMKPLLQLKITYTTTLFGLPLFASEHNDHHHHSSTGGATDQVRSCGSDDSSSPVSGDVSSGEHGLFGGSRISPTAQSIGSASSSASGAAAAAAAATGTSSGSGRSSPPLFRIKEGKSYLVVEKITTSTARDWDPR